MIYKDEIVDDVRNARKRYAERFGYDLSAIIADLRRSQEKRMAQKKAAKTPILKTGRKKGSRPAVLTDK